MSRPHARWSSVPLPSPLAQWLRAMSARIGVPHHRVLGALLDRYTESLPADIRRRLAEEHQSQRRRPQ